MRTVLMVAGSSRTRRRERHVVAPAVAPALVMVGACGVGGVDALIPGLFADVFGA